MLAKTRQARYGCAMARHQLSLPFSGQRLREIRERRGLLIRELAEQAGVHFSNVGRFESGDRVPTAPNLAKLAAALGVEIDALLDPVAS